MADLAIESPATIINNNNDDKSPAIATPPQRQVSATATPLPLVFSAVASTQSPVATFSVRASQSRNNTQCLSTLTSTQTRDDHAVQGGSLASVPVSEHLLLLQQQQQQEQQQQQQQQRRKPRQQPVFATLDSAFVAGALPHSAIIPIGHTPNICSPTASRKEVAPSRENSLAGDLARNLRNGLPNDLPVIDGDISNVIGGHLGNVIGGHVGNVIGGHVGNVIDGHVSGVIEGHVGNVIGARVSNVVGGAGDLDVSENGMLDHPHSTRDVSGNGNEDEKSRKRGLGSDLSQPNSPIHGPRKQHRPNRQKLKMLGTKSSLSELYSRGTN